MGAGKYQFSAGVQVNRLYEDRDLLDVVPMKCSVMLGLVSLHGTGGGFARDYLVAGQGVSDYSLARELRREAVACGWPTDRESLLDFGDRVRSVSTDLIAQWTFARIRSDIVEHRLTTSQILVGGFRHPDELTLFLAIRGFHTIGLRCSIPVRLARLRDQDPDFRQVTKKAFSQMHQREMGRNQPSHGHNMEQCYELVRKHGWLSKLKDMNPKQRLEWLDSCLSEIPLALKEGV